ncbi:MAG: RDD family protein [Rhodothermales bacterium]
MPAVHIQTAQNVTIAYRAAGVGHRIGAYFLDAFVAGCYLFVALFILGLAAPDGGTGWAVNVLIALPLIGYHLLSEVFFDGQSFGKRAVGIKVVALDGGQPTLGAYLLRWVLRIVDVLLFTGTVAVVAIVASRHGQRLGDMAAGTTVVKVAEPVALEETLFVNTDPAHVIQFPRVDRLTDEDVATLRDVQARFRREGRTAHTMQLLERAKTAVEQKMDIEPVAMPAPPFIRQVILDYAALDEV